MFQLPQLKPCLQNPSEPSLGILNVDLATAIAEEKAARKKSNDNSDSKETIKLGSVLVREL